MITPAMESLDSALAVKENLVSGVRQVVPRSRAQAQNNSSTRGFSIIFAGERCNRAVRGRELGGGRWWEGSGGVDSS